MWETLIHGTDFFAPEQGRYGGQRLGSGGFAYIIGDAYVDHPFLWACGNQPGTGIPRIPGGNHFTAGLARSGKY